MSRSDKYFKAQGDKWIKDAYGPTAGSDLASRRTDLVGQILERTRPNSILDIGCGDGRFLQSILISRRTGLDFSPVMLDLARKRCHGTDIEFYVCDLNELKCPDLEPYDLITMMGVIHYLKDPLRSLLVLLKLCSRNIIVSFRNRLFNLRFDSKYAASNATISDEKYLQTEADLLKANALSKVFWRNPEFFSVFEAIFNEVRFQGKTDDYWNPEHFEHWRQFTPLEAVGLLTRAGFETSDIVPIETTSNSSVSDPSRALLDCTSFLIYAEKIL